MSKSEQLADHKYYVATCPHGLQVNSCRTDHPASGEWWSETSRHSKVASIETVSERPLCERCATCDKF